jgi:IclR family KDG regulon transcriptional repressor
MNDLVRPGDNSGGTVGKALEVLEMVADQKRPVRFTTLLTQSPFPKGTLYRLLQTLTQQGMLDYDHELQTYSPGVRLVRLAHSAWNQSTLAPLARPHLDALSAQVGETIHLAQLDGGQVLYVDKRNAQNPVEMFSQAGKIGPGYCTGVGKAMLAYLPPDAQAKAVLKQSFYRHTDKTLTTADTLYTELAYIQKQGIAFDREEHETGIICVAVPILTDRGRVMGGLSITTTTQRHSLAELETLRPALQKTAHDIAGAAANWQFPS